MLKPASLQREYSLCWSGDPSLNLPAIPDVADDAPEDERKARDEIAKERFRLLRIARETGKWSDITKPGDEPTVFTFRRFPGTSLDWLQGEIRRRSLVDSEVYALAFRIAIKSIVNLGGWKLSRVANDDGIETADDDCMEKLYEVGGDAQPLLGRALIEELGMAVFIRAVQGVPPL